jgi:hypothetical protein
LVATKRLSTSATTENFMMAGLEISRGVLGCLFVVALLRYLYNFRGGTRKVT